VVLLPPAGARPGDFEAQGFHESVRRRGIAVDLTEADIGLEPHAVGGAAAALDALALAPARARGAGPIWLAGISIGAFNALHCLAARVGGVAGALLIAPYPGTGDILAEIEACGGPAAWSRTPQARGPEERAWWRWLCEESARGAWPVPVHLSSGISDRFARGQARIAELLPPQRIRMLPGGHDWATWRLLWDDWLDCGPLAVRATNPSRPG